jgi:hypothetical protein
VLIRADALEQAGHVGLEQLDLLTLEAQFKVSFTK